MPDHLYMKGIVWVSLAVWQKVCASQDLYSGEGCGNSDLLGNGAFVLKTDLCKLVRSTLVGLVRDTPLETIVDHTVLHMSEDDVAHVHSIMIQAWMHEGFVLYSHPNDPEDIIHVDITTRIVNLNETSLSHGPPTQPLDAGEGGRFAFIIPRRVERNRFCDLVLQDAVSIPLREISQWQELRQCSFVNVAATTTQP